ncbi:hypothetical protein PR202_ga24065 [Eleusine coracana subsp. coracana]|uniref:Cupin type-1 domain-containing protein n=1 Tax=Eleusine coracana subsp. coracana TaxID=191504 RepID=A0AAV5D5V9_ELECO|nr:hypothetical protein PR202_ga24065 [Eleusine coracana subsp. coracana]
MYGAVRPGCINKLTGCAASPVLYHAVHIPARLVHFQQNRGHGPAAVIAAFNSQLQGTQAIAMTLFGAMPPVPSDILAKAFRIDNGLVDAIKVVCVCA